MTAHSRISALPAAVVMTAWATGCALLPSPLPVFPTATLPIFPATTAAPTVSATVSAYPPAATPVIPTLSPASTGAPAVTDLPPAVGSTPVSHRITFPTGASSATVQGNLGADGLDRYVLRALAGQTMTVRLTTAPPNDGLIAIFGADGVVLISDAAGESSWSGTLPSTQDYIVDVESGGVPAGYTLQVSIPPVSPTAPVDEPRRISFAAGSTSATTQGVTASLGLDRFVLRALAGQTMSVSISSTEGPAILIIYGADGNVLISDHAGATSWNGTLPITQDYFIDSRSIGDAKVRFTLQVTVAPPATVPPPPTAKRITFAPGATSTTVQGTVAANGLDRWVIRVLAGQTMSIQLAPASGVVVLVVYGADGSVLQSDHVGSASFSGGVPSTQDYVLDVRGPAAGGTSYSMQVTIPPLVSQPTPKRISFPPGGTTATVLSTLPVSGVDRWVLRALVGQTMFVNTTASQGHVILIIWGVQDGNVLISDHAGATSFTGVLPSAEDYYIDVRSVGSVAAIYSMQVTIPPLP